MGRAEPLVRPGEMGRAKQPETRAKSLYSLGGEMWQAEPLDNLGDVMGRAEPLNNSREGKGMLSIYTTQEMGTPGAPSGRGGPT